MAKDNQDENSIGQSQPENIPHTPSTYVLKLYIAGHTSRSIQAISTTKVCCETYLQGRYHLEVIDIYQHVEETEAEQILIVPTLIRKLPLPQRKKVGDISSIEKLRIWLDLDAYN